ncbi:hypothetical protein BU24DRAFT_497340 [Aaosphaeria arxii CBS 175.79]|uniref:Uncharacterized protein n=1 Tax=Aaosphaeria arxii CBS 175.79 TaxID=1450172 RepID=A0A6A5X8A3_9PLEO|nr:uncharacterized protein BU24DRAFT_497340 [Aaosphaeria arxii CBS 175.79]KAF2009141.1 hypothetical protein BU24DRAFT_497340 [Aaosphaeria arxii CBS 175.79]
MNRMPLELVSMIISEIRPWTYRRVPPDEKLAHLANLSHTWQAAIESKTFRKLEVLNSELETFQQLFQGTNIRRRELVQKLYFSIKFPKEEVWDDEVGRCCPVNSKVDFDAEGDIWHRDVTKLFRILSDIEIRFQAQIGRTAPPMKLVFYNCTRAGRCELVKPSYRPCSWGLHTRPEMAAVRTRPGSVRVPELRNIPALYQVASFRACASSCSKWLHPEWIHMLASHLPNLSNMEVFFEDPYNWGRNWRREYQLALARSLDKALNRSLEVIRIYSNTQDLKNEDVDLHQISSPDITDHFSNRLLRQVSTFANLRTLYLEGIMVVSETMFQSCVERPSTIFFPQLEEFYLHFAPSSAEGHWFYLRDDAAFAAQEDLENEPGLQPGKGFIVYKDTHLPMGEVSNYYQYRSLPNPETLTPFLSSAAHFCRTLPKIKRFALKMNDRPGGYDELTFDFIDRILELWYFPGGVSHGGFRKASQCPVLPIDQRIAQYDRVYFRIGSSRLDERIVESWRKAVGVDGKINHLDQNHFKKEYCPFRHFYTGEILQEW